MNDAQTWTVIGTLIALFLGYTGITLRLMRSQFDVLSARIDGLADRLDDLADRIDKLDRDIHAVIVHLMGEGR